MNPPRILRSRVLVALVATLLALLTGTSTHAESVEAAAKAAAVTAMTAWLQGIDAGGYGPSWDAASKNFRGAITQEQWVAALNQARKPLGACSQRETASVLLQNRVPQPDGKPLAGDFAIAQFRTSFTNLFAAIETVTFEREGDGVWRASGYFVKPAP